MILPSCFHSVEKATDVDWFVIIFNPIGSRYYRYFIRNTPDTFDAPERQIAREIV